MRDRESNIGRERERERENERERERERARERQRSGGTERESQRDHECDAKSEAATKTGGSIPLWIDWLPLVIASSFLCQDIRSFELMDSVVDLILVLFQGLRLCFFLQTPRAN